MQTLATTTVDVLRGTDTDAYNDPVDTDTPVLTDVPASIIEQSRVVLDQASGTPRVVRFVTGRVAHGTDVQADDRLRDRSGQIYEVDAVARPQNPVLAQDVRLDLKHVN